MPVPPRGFLWRDAARSSCEGLRDGFEALLASTLVLSCSVCSWRSELQRLHMGVWGGRERLCAAGRQPEGVPRAISV